MADLDFALLCHSAMSHDGLLSILGAGFDRITGESMPIRSVITLVARARLDEDDLGRVIRVGVDVLNPDENSIAQVDGELQAERPVKAMPIGPIGSVMIMPLPLELAETGFYRFVLTLDGNVASELSLYVSTTAP